MKSATQALEQKGTNLWTVQPAATLGETLRSFQKKVSARKIMFLSFVAFTGLLYVTSMTLLAAAVLPAVLTR